MMIIMTHMNYLYDFRVELVYIIPVRIHTLTQRANILVKSQQIQTYKCGSNGELRHGYTITLT